MMDEMGLIIPYLDDVDQAASASGHHNQLARMMSSDYIVGLNRPNTQTMLRLKDIHQLQPLPTAPYGDLKNPPSIVWSIDDNYHWVHPLNPSFQYNGYRLMDGTMLKNTDVVSIRTRDGGTEVLWTGGRTYNGEKFLPEENKMAIDRMDDFIKDNALIVLLASPELERFYREEIGYHSTMWFPNTVHFDDYFGLANTVFSRSTKNVRVLWQGGGSHFQDLYPVRDPLLRCLARNRNTQMIIWGQLYTWITQDIPDEQFMWIPWVHYEAYKSLMSMLDYDFAIAPLVENVFNTSKTAIKAYEAAATPIPKPTLAARVPPYSDEFEEDVSIAFYDPHDPQEFEAKFERLVKDPEYREKLGRNAKEWIREHRYAKTWAKTLFDKLQSLRGPGIQPNPGLSDLIEVARR